MPNFLRCDDMRFLFLLRVPTEGPCAKRARIDQDMLPARPLDSQSILWVAGETYAQKLVFKIEEARKYAEWRDSYSPRMCQGSIMNPNGFFPVRRFWPIIQLSVRPGAHILPGYAKSNINRIAKCDFAQIHFGDSDRFTSKFFRRGRSNAMKDSDSTMCQITRARPGGVPMVIDRISFYNKATRNLPIRS